MRYLIVAIVCSTLFSCGSKDPQTIIGYWQNENHWFEFHNDSLYSGGVGPITNVKNVLYKLEPSEGKLTFYTQQENETYYLRYKFVHQDSLSLSNFMNNTSQAVIYYRSKK
jgi:hypothetical protein